METLLYSELNILTLTILTVIALRSRAFGFDRSTKGLLFSTSIWFSAAANLFDFLWKLGWSEYVSLPAGAFWVINFCYFIAFGCSCYCWFFRCWTAMHSRMAAQKNKKSGPPFGGPVNLISCFSASRQSRACARFWPRIFPGSRRGRAGKF